MSRPSRDLAGGLVLRSSARSDVGCVRRRNEDAFAIDGDRGVFLVADGMGGHGNGDIAASIAADTICDSLGKTPVVRWSNRPDRDKDRMSDRLRHALNDANHSVRTAMHETPELAGMGATAVVLVIDSEFAYLANVGDSRAYRLRAGRLEQLTDDHTWVREQISAGLLSEEQARFHPFRSVVTRALGGDDGVLADLYELEANPGDLYLLCSDGLTAVLSDDDIRLGLQPLVPDEPLEAQCRRLVDEANSRGGPDNITVLLIAVDERN